MPGVEGRIFVESKAVESARDPLLDLINAYRSGVSDFIANAPEDQHAANIYAENSYRPSRRRLVGWDSPALTLDGAVSAIKMARDADQNDDAEIVSAMVKAACRYFEISC